MVEVGGGIRSYENGGRPVLESYSPTAICDGAHGALLIPWPNRVADGRYQFDGQTHQLALTEPEQHHAIHGLMRWRAWTEQDHQPHRVELATRLYPSSEYPFQLDLRVGYELGPGGLVVTIAALNSGHTACPFAAGQHPYLSPGDGPIDACTLEVAAETRIVTDDRQIPVGSEPTRGGADDWSKPHAIGNRRLDDAFTDLVRDGEGRAWVRLGAPDGGTVELWADRHFPVMQVFTGDTLEPGRRRRGLAVEPMSAPANAFQSGQGLVRLEPGQEWRGSWGVRLKTLD